MDNLQIENMCLFCTTKCCPKFLIEYDGKLTKFKTETDSAGLFFGYETTSGISADELLVIEEDLKAIFIVGTLLNIPRNIWNQYLSKHDGQYRPGLWFPVCELCDTIVGQCYQCCKEINTLTRALENGKKKLKERILRSMKIKLRAKTGNYDDTVWKSIRREVNVGFKDHVSDEFDNENQSDENYCPNSPQEKTQISSLTMDQLTKTTRKLSSKSPEAIERKMLIRSQSKVKQKRKTKHSLKLLRRRMPITKLNPTSDKFQKWSVITPTPSDEQIKQKWRVYSTLNLPNYKTITYYCSGGLKCGARLKKRISSTFDEVIVEVNNVEHSNHREKLMITTEQKKIILDCLHSNIRRPTNIVAMFKQQNKIPPKKLQVSNFLSRLRKENPSFERKLPSPCQVCGKKCRTIFALDRHQKKTHQVNTYIPKPPTIDTKTTAQDSLLTDDADHFKSENDKDESKNLAVEHASNRIDSSGLNTEDTKSKVSNRSRALVKKSKSHLITKKDSKRRWLAWSTIIMPEEEFQNEWKVYSTDYLSDCKVVTYYCIYGGSSCCKRIKKRIFHNNSFILESNNIEHSNHRNKPIITAEHRQLILKCLNDAIEQPDRILSILKEKTTTPPTIAQLKSFLARQRSKNLVLKGTLGEGLFLSSKKNQKGKDKLYGCEYCDKRCKSLFALELHQSTAHLEELKITPLMCEDCGFSTGSTRHFNAHKKSECPGSKIFKLQHVCNICGHVYKHKRNLEQHMSSYLHQDAGEEEAPQNFKYDDGSYVCNYCGERMSKGVSLASHLKAKHLDKTKIELRCNGCLQVFDKIRLLWSHRKICLALGGDGGAKIAAKTLGENGMKVYRCKYCPMEFQSTSIRLRHKKTAHADVYLQHMCDLCGESFTSINRVTKHRQVCGDDKQSQKRENTCVRNKQKESGS